MMHHERLRNNAVAEVNSHPARPWNPATKRTESIELTLLLCCADPKVFTLLKSRLTEPCRDGQGLVVPGLT
jgi:hypothetical protein